jgi:hypothetical protein
MNVGVKNLLLNSDDCHNDLIYWHSSGKMTTNSSGTCCGESGPNNLKFKKDFPSTGMLAMLPCGALVDQCVTLGGPPSHSLTLSKCTTGSQQQQWTFGTKNTIRSVGTPDQCVDGSSGPPPPPPGKGLPPGGGC